MTTSPVRCIMPKTGGFSFSSVPRPRSPFSRRRRPSRPFFDLLGMVRLCLNRHEWFSRSERKATSFQLDSFWVEPVGYGLPTGSGLLFERLLPELHRPSRERESGNGGVARRSRALAARESRVPPAGRILEESPPRCLAPHRRVGAGSRTTRGSKAATPSRSLRPTLRDQAAQRSLQSPGRSPGRLPASQAETGPATGEPRTPATRLFPAAGP